MDSEDLRSLYANLLAKAMNEDTKDKVHPAFVEVIKQMSPRDASNLSVFPNSIRNVLPVAKYIERWRTHIAFSEIIVNAFISNPSYIDMEEQASSITLLETLGLVSTSYTSYCPTPDAYALFSSTKLYRECESINFTRNKALNELTKDEYLSIFSENKEREISVLSIEHGTVQLTPFGLHFKQVCMS